MVDAETKLTADELLVKQQYLTFKIGSEEYGVDILSVQEIHSWVEPRPMPSTPDYIKGVIDWREVVVPIIDLRIRFKYENVTYDNTTVIIILKSEDCDGNSYTFGIVVDAVADVYDVLNDELKRTPNMGNKIDTQYIKGIAKIDDSIIIMLRLNQIINFDELENLNEL